MKSTLTFARRAAGAIYRQLNPSPEVASWRRADALAATVPRYTPGRIRILEYDVEYADLLTFCPQFHDIFVQRTLQFQSPTESPRILDCGSNVGLASLFFKRLYPAARITAYEADPALCAMTRRNLEGNGAADVEVIQAAVWISTGSLTFRAEGSDAGMIDGLSGAVDAKSITVPGLRLRDVIARDRVDFLKIDIEGAEAAVLEDCEPVLDRVHAIVMELHEFDPRNRQSARVFDCLARSGFVYSASELLQHHWRPPVAAAESPFPGLPLVWSMAVRAWRA